DWTSCASGRGCEAKLTCPNRQHFSGCDERSGKAPLTADCTQSFELRAVGVGSGRHYGFGCVLLPLSARCGGEGDRKTSRWPSWSTVSSDMERSHGREGGALPAPSRSVCQVRTLPRSSRPPWRSQGPHIASTLQAGSVWHAESPRASVHACKRSAAPRSPSTATRLQCVRSAARRCSRRSRRR